MDISGCTVEHPPDDCSGEICLLLKVHTVEERTSRSQSLSGIWG